MFGNWLNKLGSDVGRLHDGVEVKENTVQLEYHTLSGCGERGPRVLGLLRGPVSTSQFLGKRNSLGHDLTVGYKAVGNCWRKGKSRTAMGQYLST